MKHKTLGQIVAYNLVFAGSTFIVSAGTNAVMQYVRDKPQREIAQAIAGDLRKQEQTESIREQIAWYDSQAKFRYDTNALKPLLSLNFLFFGAGAAFLYNKSEYEKAKEELERERQLSN